MAAVRVDGLQYARWSEKVFREWRQGGVDAVHVTVAYHEDFRGMVANVEGWNRFFADFPELLLRGGTAADVERAAASGRTAVFFGFQNPSPIGDDLGLVEVCYDLGVRFMQLSYNNQSLLATGYCEAEDAGITRFGREVVGEMNRLGMVVDMSHSAERSTLQAIEVSSRPIAVTHANPSWWRESPRNKSDTVLRAVAESGGMLGLSLYPHHLRDGAECSLQSFCGMVAAAAERYGVAALGIGSDLCQDQPDEVVAWMRNGRWRFAAADDDEARFPAPLPWFRDNRDFPALAEGLAAVGFSASEVDAVMGNNWLAFFRQSFGGPS